jgi:hypothetical protein
MEQDTSRMAIDSILISRSNSRYVMLAHESLVGLTQHYLVFGTT